VFRSKSVEQLFLSFFPRPQNSFVATSGIPAHEILQESAFLPKTFHHPLRLLSVASLIPQKNIDIVLRALALLPPKSRWSYTIVGDGQERANLESLTDGLGLRERVSFLGQRPRSECLEIMGCSDVFVLVSAPETFGLAYLEAMAKGMLVIAAEGTGIAGIIEHGRNGYLCQPRNTAGLRQVLESLLGLDAALAMRLAAYQTVKEFTLERRALDYLRFLASVRQDFDLTSKPVDLG
jgi:glycosyltransferase involved in cell wall biosynthesis